MKHLIAAAAALALFAGSAVAQGYYEGKRIEYIIATEPGGGYDTYGRLVGRYLGKHLKADRVVFKNLPGAGHLIGANTLNASKPDGLTLGTFNTGLIYSQILGSEGVRFDLKTMSWIGKAASDPRVMVMSMQSGFVDYDSLKAASGPHLFAAAGVGSASFSETNLLARALDLDIKVVSGFNGNEGELAMMRGEVIGQIASLSSITPFVAAGNGVVVLSIGGEGQPQAIDKAVTEDGRGIVNLIAANSVIGRLTAAPPGVAPEVLAELRAGYSAALADPELLAEAATLGIPIDAADGAEVEDLITAALSQSPETVEIVRAALTAQAPLVKVTTPIIALADENREVTIKGKDGEIVIAPSGSRTQILVNGAEAKRGNLVVGMECEIEYDPAKEGNEPKKIDCKG
ncbi:MAG: Bug family tripartite tricarboxylate transporter substrate binding protein [Paracoccaceae bacterium]